MSPLMCLYYISLHSDWTCSWNFSSASILMPNNFSNLLLVTVLLIYSYWLCPILGVMGFSKKGIFAESSKNVSAFILKQKGTNGWIKVYLKHKETQLVSIFGTHFMRNFKKNWWVISEAFHCEWTNDQLDEQTELNSYDNS